MYNDGNPRTGQIIMKLVQVQLFTKTGNKRAQVYSHYCTCPSECPLLKKNKCLQTGILSSCIYGKTSIEDGPTPRSGKYNEFVMNVKQSEDYKSTRDIDGYGLNVMFEIGDYIYLPYSHMDLIALPPDRIQLPFVRNSTAFTSGSSFVKKDNFDVQFVINVVKKKPQAMIGGEIKHYQQRSVPAFLWHLKGLFPDLFESACNEYSQIIDIVSKTTIKPDKYGSPQIFLGDVSTEVQEELGFVVGKIVKISLTVGDLGFLGTKNIPLKKMPDDTALEMSLVVSPEMQIVLETEEMQNLILASYPHLIGAEYFHREI
jgi:hypothetical protein